MAYTVLARKYRSRTFDEVIGQKPVATTLANSIKTGRIHHGYLFTGTRGVGKTSMARILAKSLNCLASDGPTTKPCLKCDACVAIAEGQDIDVVEIDAASNTGVDNIRELRGNTAYRPARSRFKIYIIDEVHMLSTGAFNALLKTLEEPPAHVKFILATTELQKVPATIRSRCQCFNFRNIGPDEIAQRLAWIAQQEQAAVDPAVVRRVARLANGSMRDGLSILDQLLSVSPEKVTPEVLDEILPPAHDEQVLGLIAQAAGGDAAATLQALEDALAGGRGVEVMCNDVIESLRSLMLVRACGPDSSLADVPAGNRGEHERLAGQFELSHYVQMIAMLEELRRNVRFSGAGRALADAVFLRIARIRQWGSIEQLLGQTPAQSPDQKKKPLTTAGPPAATSASPPGSVERRRAADTPVVAGPRSVERAQVAAPAEAALRAPQPVAASAGGWRPESSSDIVEGPLPDASDWRLESEEEVPPATPAGEAAVADEPDGQRYAPLQSSEPVRRQANSRERAEIMADPAVRQALELFDGVVVNLEKIVTPRASADEPG